MRTVLTLTFIASAALLAACSNPESGKTGEAGKSEAPAAAAKAPKAGLWEQTTSGGMIPAPMTVKMCIGDPVEGSNPFEAPPAAGSECTQSGTATDFKSTCTTNGMTVTSAGKVTGDMNSAYKVELTTTTTGANVPPQMAEMKMTIDAKRVGDCPAGVQPGAIVQ